VRKNGLRVYLALSAGSEAHRREHILSSLIWPIRAVSKAATAENASVDIHQVASIDEIVELILAEFEA
jgi:hypothetical protein